MFGSLSDHLSLEQGYQWAVDGLSSVDVVNGDGAIRDQVPGDVVAHVFGGGPSDITL